MSRVIRTGRVSGSGVVTLGRHESDLFFDPKAPREKAPAIDLEALLALRLEALCAGLAREWEGRLLQEHETMRAAAERQQAEAAQLHRQEVERVHQERYEEGHRDGVAAKEGEARQAVERLAAVHESVRHERAQVLLEAETLVVDLATAVARRVTRVQAASDPRVLARTVRAALQQLSERSDLVIKVHADDLQIARKFLAAWVDRTGSDAVLKVEAGERVDRGGCLVEGREENVDARLEPQLDVLQRALREAVAESYEAAETGAATAASLPEGPEPAAAEPAPGVA